MSTRNHPDHLSYTSAVMSALRLDLGGRGGAHSPGAGEPQVRADTPIAVHLPLCTEYRPCTTAYSLPFPMFALVSASTMVEGEIETFAPVIPWWRGSRADERTHA